MALSGHNHFFFAFRDTNLDTLGSLRPETRDVAMRVSGRKWVHSTELDIANGSFLQFTCFGSFSGVTYLRYTVLTSSNKSETAQCPLLRPCFIGSCHVGVSKRFSCSISLAVYCLYTFLFWPFRSLVDLTLAAFIVCGPLQFVTELRRLEKGFSLLQCSWNNGRL